MGNELFDYYIKEFDMLKDAHFQTSQKIISFFQFALLIFSAPIALLASEQISRLVLGMVFLIIGFIEVFVIAYLSSLRAEALLYARQINRIRNVLYSKGVLGESDFEKYKSKILFSQDKKPQYKDMSQFIFIVIVLGVFSSFYVSFGLFKLLTSIFSFNLIIIPCGIAGLAALSVFALSFLMHFYIARVNENGQQYYNQIIGVDIDGVLNKHEETFVDTYQKVTGKRIQVENIKTLPVHLSGNVTIEDERKVFEVIEYWENQAIVENVKEYLIDEIRNKLGFKPYVFTWRDWTVKKNIKGDKVNFNIKKQTKKWLKKSGIIYSKLKFEKGNYDRPVSYFSSKYKTRYYYAAKYKIRYFVEDNLRNAEKLAHICEYVFLIDHKYNSSDILVGDLPYNIIRVKDWSEILEKLKTFS